MAITHGMRNTRIYSIWCGMKKRCALKSHKAFPNYGGRGITVCQEWLTFENFYAWSRISGYAENLTIDRIDNNKGYFAENCRWVTLQQNSSHRRTNILTIDQVKQIKTFIAAGVRGCEIAAKFSINQKIVSNIKNNKRWKGVI